MKKLLLLIPLLLIGCEKREKDEPRRQGNIATNAATVTTTYNGSLTPVSAFNVPVNASLYAGEAIYVYICMGVVCDADNLPALTCAESARDASYATGWETTAQCYTSTPSPYIAWGMIPGQDHATVSIIQNAFTQGYTSYAIKTIVFE